MSLLQCIGLVKQYPGKRAVDGVSFHVEQGEIVGLLGPNGAGKSTSFSMACGLVKPTAGRVIFNDVDVTNWPLFKRAQHGMGYLPQNNSIFGKLSVEQNLYAVLEFQPKSYRDRMARADELLGMFGLIDKRQQTAGTLSGRFDAKTRLRPMWKLCSPTWLTQPTMTSSTAAGSMWVRSTMALMTSPPRSAGCQFLSAPPRRPPAVRNASTI